MPMPSIVCDPAQSGRAAPRTRLAARRRLPADRGCEDTKHALQFLDRWAEPRRSDECAPRLRAGWLDLFEYQCQQSNYAPELMVGQHGKVDRSTLIIP